jgi:chemotaxis protein CheD
MMADVFVNMGELKVQKGDGRLITVGLGSCVGVAILDVDRKIGGLAHVFLADSGKHKQSDQLGKFADTAIPALVEEVVKIGGRRQNLIAKIAGGAHLFPGIAGSSLNVGKQNVEAVRYHLKRMGIRLVAQDVEGNYGRKLIVYVAEGRVVVQAIGQPEKEL